MTEHLFLLDTALQVGDPEEKKSNFLFSWNPVLGGR